MILRLAVRFHGLFHRGPELNAPCWVCEALWRRLERDPQWGESLSRGVADIEAGRYVKWSEIRHEGDES